MHASSANRQPVSQLTVQRAAVNHLHRVDDVTQRLGHLLAVLIAYHGVQVDSAERQLVREVQRHHHHARHPEKQDIQSGLQQTTGYVQFIT